MSKIITTLFVVGFFAFAGYAFAATTVIVHPGNTSTTPTTTGWFFSNDGIPTGTGSFVSGPAGQPMGVGSVQLSVDATGRSLISTVEYAGTKFADLTKLEYATYNQTTTTAIAPSLQFDVDYDLTDANTAWQGRLVYEPYQTPGNTVTSGAWQTWNPLDANAKWWATGGAGAALCPQSTPCTTAQVLSAFPNAGLRANIGLLHMKLGGPIPGGFTANVDKLTVGVNGEETTYDFEPYARPLSKDDCKKGKFEIYTFFNFKNQGQCVAWFNQNN